MPRRDLKFHTFFRSQKHPLAVCNRYDHIEWNGGRLILDVLDGDRERVLADEYDRSEADASLPVGETNRVAAIGSACPRVPHRWAVKAHLSHHDCLLAVEADYGRETATLHQMPSSLAARVFQPASRSVASIPALSSTRMPLRIAASAE